MGLSSTHRIDILNRETTQPSANNRWVAAAHQLGIESLTGCQQTRVFFVRGQLSDNDLQRFRTEILVDPVVEVAQLNSDTTTDAPAFIETTLQPGVTDPVAENLVRVAQRLGIAIESAATGERFVLQGDLTPSQMDTLARKVFSNPVIQRYSINEAIDAPFVDAEEGDGFVEIIPLRDADDDALLAISTERRLSLDLREMQAIRDWYADEGRDPTDVELEMLAQTWSEHCVHKTFRALIDFTDADGKREQIDGLLNTYIRAATEKVNKPWVRSAFVDNAGIVAFTDEYDLAFKVETHNHPSALEPFGGANTGIGGVIRDVLGVSAKPIANTDVLCFGPQDWSHDDLIEGVLHPQRVAHGVVHGIEDYGNKMGIPTVNGSIIYDEGYIQNPLVYCGCLGILPHDSHPTAPQAGDLIVVLGGRTGRDGLRGATFSSMEMDTSTSEIASISVQIGHPIQEKQVQEVILHARDEKLYHAITDCGAGGLSSAIGEMGEDLGATVQLQDVPLKYPGLRPWEIWLSEAQERMVMAVPRENWDRLQAIAKGQDVEATAIGTYGTDNRRLVLQYGERVVGDITMDLLHECRPKRELRAEWNPPTLDEPANPVEFDIAETLLKLLAHPNIASKEDVVRRYDHEVQGGTVVKPLVGANADGPSDAAVLVPLATKHSKTDDGSVRGVALSNGICPQYGAYDPYAMAWAAVDEAFRNLVAVGADPDQVALLDNFCWGNPALPDRLGSLVMAAKGCYDAAVAYNAPYISGKDSLNNEYADADGTRHPIPGTLLISAMGIVPDVADTVTSDFKHDGNPIYIIGETSAELGGSHAYRVHGIMGGTVPQPNEIGLATMRAVHAAIREGVLDACHDVSEGGLAVALAEMCLGGHHGAAVKALDAQELFSESLSRFVVEVANSEAAVFERIMREHGVPVQIWGSVTEETNLIIGDTNISLDAMRGAFHGHVPQQTPPVPEAVYRSPAAPAQKQPPRVAILHANGTNRDGDAALAVEQAGGLAEIVHLNQLRSGERDLMDYGMVVVPGGFSYGDDLGAGQLWALDFQHEFQDTITRFAADGRPVLGICNGFQVLLKAGLLTEGQRDVTLTHNASGKFECRWVELLPEANSKALFLDGVERILCPVAHGEGRIAVSAPGVVEQLRENGQIALTYRTLDETSYPANPNGSAANIAALCNPQGNVMGLMPHPEDHLFPWQHPQIHRGREGYTGLILFANGIKRA